MIKKITPLLLFFLLILFVGCDISSPEETVLGVKQVSLDANIPPEDQLVKITDELMDVLSETVASIVRTESPVFSQIKNSSSAKYVAKGGATYKEKEVSGSVSIKNDSSDTNDKSTTELTINGDIKLGDDKYSLNDFSITYDVDYSEDEPEMVNYRFNGSIKLNEETLTLDKLTQSDLIISLLSFSDAESFVIFKAESVNYTTASYSSYKSDVAKGEYSSCQKTLSDASTMDVRFNFSEVQTEKYGKHSFSCRFTMVTTTDNKVDINLQYLRLDDSYFSPSSLEENEEFLPLIFTLFLIGV